MNSNRKRTIGVDFDHTLVDFDKPLPGAKEAMQRLWENGDYILIYSCNNPQWIEKVLEAHDIPYHEIYGKDGGKPVCDAYIDDRAIAFDGDWKKALADLDDLGNRSLKIRGLL